MDEATNSITAECLDDDEGSCTFTNVLIARNVPTLSQWGLISLIVLLGIVGFIFYRRRATA
ncbi:MAG: IPTL-CTERM sorting domain-containing protein [Candidatus Dadabacteria bacterium]|nr:MAG: IPTL-CTERM sorting domain-containing protein [Candidatus Dadabacteria bacterium]